MNEYPTIIQGGMGAAVSHWALARAVSMKGQLGVVSGTALATVICRKLQRGDVGGHYRRALEHFPVPDIAHRVLKEWYRADGIHSSEPFRLHPMYTVNPSRELLELTVTSAFAEVYLAKEGHDGAVGMNLLEKVRLPNLSTLYGAMLAGVDYVLMGAGIPMEIPGVLDGLARYEPVRLRVPVDDSDPSDECFTAFNPCSFVEEPEANLKRPKFLAIISSVVLATALVKKASGRVDGFVIEASTAGGHNAPPRVKVGLNDRGEPIYGPKDEVDLDKIRALGLPFWLAGGHARPEKLQEAVRYGAQGIQVGTAFAFCRESGFTDEIKRAGYGAVALDTVDVFTDPSASPTGFPFKVANLPGTLADARLYATRQRICDLGYLRQAYRKEDGSIGYRCPSEPIDQYVKKGGAYDDTMGRKCLCNALSAAVGYGQIHKDGTLELPLVTAGDEFRDLRRFMGDGEDFYTAESVIETLMRV